MRDLMRSARTVFGFAYRADPVRSILVIISTIGAISLMSLEPLVLRVIADRALHHDTGGAIAAAVVMAVVWLATAMSGWFGFLLRRRVEEHTGLVISEEIMRLTSRIATIEHHERPEYLDKIELLRTDRESLALALGTLVYTLSIGVQLVIVAGLLASVSPALLVLPVFALPSLLLTARAQKIFELQRDAMAESTRAAEHIYTIATTPAAAKEVRVFGLAPELTQRYAGLWRPVVASRDRARRVGAGLNAIGWTVFGLGYVGAIAFAVARAVSGDLSLGGVLMTVTLAGRVNSIMSQSAGMVSYLAQQLKVVGRYLWLVDHAAAVEAGQRRREDATPVPERLVRGIDFESLSFSYPGTGAPVLTDVSLHLPAGSTVAVVGDNGAGKSTLVKLLMRFYEPESGRITVDGVDLSCFDIDAWRARTSGAFQDFVRYELVAGETVGVGDVDRLADDAAVYSALERASSRDVVDALDQGLATQLGRTFDGVELSGGQWQKLALGRAMMRDRPLLLVLDEPTASLDPETEASLFDRYALAARAMAAETGGITVLVSHRFSTVRMADLIVVVDNGRVREFGSHSELVMLGGLYAELYELQARAYR
jgi:ATP-binding cassette subfamily B protein